MSHFASCEICGTKDWRTVYRGPIRDGIFGQMRDDTSVAVCGGCGVQRLEEDACTPDSYYETEEYRAKLRQGLDSASYFKGHDHQQIHTLRTIAPASLRGLTVADVGCGGGSLLDHLRGISARQVAVEPYEIYRSELEARGYTAYPYAADAARDWQGGIDLAFSMQVIEHTSNPREFLSDIRPLLGDGGRLVISTPNLDDILFDLVPDDFPQFFYRVVHRWYFDRQSLAECARRAGYDVDEVRFVHRYGMANALLWMRERRPSGATRLASIDAMADDLWSAYLANTGRADCLYMVLRPSAG